MFPLIFALAIGSAGPDAPAMDFTPIVWSPRRLTKEEQALWDEVQQTLIRLRQAKQRQQARQKMLEKAREHLDRIAPPKKK
jgi:hypothetical protein